MAGHSRECAHADVGSLCDCDCAGAQHATERTKGGVPGAGAVSRRAQAIAHREHRPAVVNNNAEPVGDDDRHRASGDPNRRKPAPGSSRSSVRTPALSPTVKRNADDVRARLPKDTASWKRAALHDPTPQEVYAAGRARDTAANNLARVQAAQDAIVAGHAATIAVELSAKGSYYGTPEQIRDTARNVAPHRAWGDPAWNALDLQRTQAGFDLRDAEQALNKILAGPSEYRVDAGTGLRMPSQQLAQHLQQVTEVGRQALQEAKAAWSKNPPKAVTDAQQLLPQEGRLRFLAQQIRVAKTTTGGLPRTFVLPEGGIARITTKDELKALETQVGQRQADIRAARAIIANHQADTLRTMLAEHRDFGGTTHHNAVARRNTVQKDPDGKLVITDPRTDWRARLQVAEQHFPTDWLYASAGRALHIGASRRAFQGGADPDSLSMSDHSFDAVPVTGALDDIDEVTVHEMGHRMETIIPGLTHLEFAYVRQRATLADGTVQPLTPIAGFKDQTEVAQKDDWGRAYAGKSYEVAGGKQATPGDEAWEVFQVGLQDTFGRGPTVYGADDDPEELQAFVIGALLTLG